MSSSHSPSPAPPRPDEQPCPALDTDAQWDDADALRGEIYVADHLISHATELARCHGEPSHSVTSGRLWPRFLAVRDQIHDAYRVLTERVRANQDPSPAEEWLLENSHVVEDQIREIKEDLPRGYLLELRRVATGKMRGYPRVYALCLDYLRHTDARLDIGTLSEYVLAYQREQPLTIGELWAIPIMLRLGLLLTVGSLAAAEASAGTRERADAWARRLVAARASARSVRAELSELENDLPANVSAFLVHLERRLREHDDATLGIASDWIAARSKHLGKSLEDLIRLQNLKQAADQVSVGNAITSMRSVAALDWNDFFERTSEVEALLRQDPTETYARTNAATRDRYRHAIEALARRSKATERAVAQAALDMARAAKAHTPDDVRQAHVGYYLIDAGRGQLEATIEYRPGLGKRLLRTIENHPSAIYFGSIGFLTAAILAVTVWSVGAVWWSVPLLFALGVLCLLPASEIALALTHAWITATLPPRLLPRLDLDEGIPDELRTLVVVPCLLDSRATLEELLEDLEVRSLANDEPNVYFALLTDFSDAQEAETERDAELLTLAKRGIAALNERFRKQPNRYWLLHRQRCFSPNQGRFIGWERKRGKLEELNRLLRGAQDTSFSCVVAPTELFASIRYVITLDADTQLPRDTARELIATLGHPLNRAEFDVAKHRVTRGYGIVQPRVGALPASSRRSRYAIVSAGPSGIDPYTTAVSDVYQDLFAEGSYTGKGIYDVDAFSSAMHGRVPQDALLSHDLFESFFVRSALATDIELLDEQPSAYEVHAGRQHRWMRGDWQLVRWMLPTVPWRDGSMRRNDLRALDRWKLFDNLRRSLVPPALVVLCVSGWFAGGTVPIAATALLLAFLCSPIVARLVLSLARKPARSTSRLLGLGDDLARDGANVFVNLTTLLDQALLSLDAITLALYRLLWSHKSLLEWTAMRQSAAANRLLPARRTLLAGALSVVTLVAVAALRPGSLPYALPILLLWACSPFIVQWLSRPLVVKRANQQLRAADKRLLRLVARKTWRFFDQLVGEEENHLPPDNFQEEPRGVVAHRTSPTNIGLYMLSTLAAHDLGFIPMGDMLQRLTLTMDTLDKLPRRDGHLLNWYDTQTLRALAPEYVSTVDSGNLAGYLWTLSVACGELRRAPLATPEVWRAIADALHLANKRDEHRGKLNPTFSEQLRKLERRVTKNKEATAAGLVSHCAELRKTLDELRALRQNPVLLPQASHYWLGEAERTAQAWYDRLLEVAPYLPLLAGPPPTEPHVAVAWQEWRLRLERIQNLDQLPDVLAQTGEQVRLWVNSRSVQGRAPDSSIELPVNLLSSLRRGHDAAKSLLGLLETVATRCSTLADGMNFTFLFDRNRELFVTGYNVTSARLDTSYYDLLASEARLASLIAVAKGDVPLEHWFRLGRPRARVTSERSLLSWSGSMFEYLMPLLVTRYSRQSLIGETMHAAVNRQRAYGAEHGVPWGISESAYNVMDLEMTYQYRAFGVPGLGLKAGLAEDLVVAPYATVLACLVEPVAAVKNLRALAKEGLSGQYGYYEAIDYSPTRLPPGKRGVVVKSFMAHHLGMSLVAIGNVLHDNRMVRRFHTDLRVKATELLLEERIPSATPLLRVPDAAMVAPIHHAVDLDAREHVYLKDKHPIRAHLIGRRVISSLTTTHGAGALTWNGLDINRFREDAALDSGGIFAYVRNVTEGKVWSAGYLPTRATPDSYEAAFSIDRVELHRKDGHIETTTELAPSPEHAAEVRRFTFTNRGKLAADVELTTYTELVLAPRAADLAHRAFSGMFIETEYLPERGALVAHRRKRSPNEPEMWVAQVLTPEDDSFGSVDFDTSRATFIGRNGSLEMPSAFKSGSNALGRNTGPVLDPAFVLRRRAKLSPGARLRVALTTLAADSREEILRLVDTYAAPQAIPRVFELAWADARVELRHLGITAVQAHRFQRLLSATLFPQAALRWTGEPSSLSHLGKTALWSRGISGDLPLIVLRLDHPDFIELCREVLLAHEHFRINGVSVDLLILNEEPGGYLTPQQDQALGLIRSLHAEGRMDQHGGIFLRRAEQIPESERNLALAAARVVLSASRGSLTRQLKQATENVRVEAQPLTTVRLPQNTGVHRPVRPTLLYDNGFGGFTPDGREYWMEIAPYLRTPAPWCNVIANPQFGSVISDGGSSFTWYGNSQRHRLTPWSNDAIGDTSGEVIYVRDDDSGSTWSATPRPHGGQVHYAVAHGQGYTRFEHVRGDLHHELTMFVDAVDPVRIHRLRVVNNGKQTRRLSLFGVVEWVLGNNRETSRTMVMTRTEGRAIVATNPFSAFNSGLAFFTTTATVRSVTGDREEFFGTPGSRSNPAGLGRLTLSGKVGVGLDPCGVLHCVQALAAGETLDISFVLGQASNPEQLRALLTRYEAAERAERSFEETRKFWDEMVSAISIRTPDNALNVLFNRWLPYQALSCRIWARSGFYQSSGAYGYRDQVQDVLSVLHSTPRVAREHLLKAAARQFVEGDVQHWWHPEAGDGVRTHCSDDMLWLPYAVVEYIRVTGDAAILDEQVTFLTERQLAAGEDDLYSVPPVTHETASLYEHCARALEVALDFGPHGLPKIGAGDWNDGMSRIGHEGVGESVWLGWFLSKALRDFAPIAEERGEHDRARQWNAQASSVVQAIETHAWDGAWYRRAYFDDGTPVGTHEAAECRIDAIAQSWATIAGGGDPLRAARALRESERLLLDRNTNIMQLLTPPFAHSEPDPGYISSYPAGIRENGGQYTHGVLFTLRALAQSGDQERTTRLLEALNPILHGDTPAHVARYKVEPYVVAADVYSSPNHLGRGGWTWYTGAAGWFYRVVLEDIVGLQRFADKITFKPCVPPTWESFEVTYRYGSSRLHIHVDARHKAGAMRLVMNDTPLRDLWIPLRDDGRTHHVRLELGEQQLRSSA